MNHETYASGQFAEKINSAIEQADEIREIIESISGRELDEDWFPYKPLGSDGSMDNVTVTGYEKPFVHWTDGHGNSGSADIRKAEGRVALENRLGGSLGNPWNNLRTSREKITEPLVDLLTQDCRYANYWVLNHPQRWFTSGFKLREQGRCPRHLVIRLTQLKH